MRLSWWKALGGFFLAAILSAPAWGANSPRPGTINYFEGQVQIGARALNSKSIGSAELHGGQSLTTENGKAEVLLTPGVFLRVGDFSSVKMISPDLANTRVRLTKGQAMVEVDEIYKANDIHVLQDGASIRLLKRGLYDFDVPQRQVRVFKGQALVREGKRHTKVGGNHEVSLNVGGPLKSRGFHKKVYEGALYRFSKLRSDYLAEATRNGSQVYVASGWSSPGWYGSGWYWDPWLGGYTILPLNGVLYSPFGFGFSPLYYDETPFFGFHDHFERVPDFDHHFGHVPDFDHHPEAMAHPGEPFEGGHPPVQAFRGPAPGIEPRMGGPRIAPRMGGPGFEAERPAMGAFHAPSAIAPHLGGFPRGPAMGAVHAPAFHGGGFHGGPAFHGGGFHR